MKDLDIQSDGNCGNIYSNVLSLNICTIKTPMMTPGDILTEDLVSSNLVLKKICRRKQVLYQSDISSESCKVLFLGTLKL